MPRIASPADVHYLALEGGGGKGVTYLGAIRALESMGVLPIDINNQKSNQIRGISGASAGAITAMFLAMGFTSVELQAVLSKSTIFRGFFDGPSLGVWRSVNQKNSPDLHNNAPVGINPSEYIRQRRESISGWTQLASAVGLLARNGVFGPTTDPIVAKLKAYPELFLYNLVFDRGLFPGFAARHFLQSQIYGRLWDKLTRPKPSRPRLLLSINGSEINFSTFYDLTGIDLVITGANVTRHKPAVFSMRHTPQFPVAEAVGISMSLPLLFKPVQVEADVPVGQHNQRSDDYHGRWIDGGVLNNFPLHAFDFLSPVVAPNYPNLRPLNANILGLRLTDGYPPESGRPSSPGPQGAFDVLLEFLGDVTGTVLYPSEEGQIRSADERDQTIDLFTYDLKTTEFAPPASATITPVTEAERSVKSYFG